MCVDWRCLLMVSINNFENGTANLPPFTDGAEVDCIVLRWWYQIGACTFFLHLFERAEKGECVQQLCPYKPRHWHRLHP